MTKSPKTTLTTEEYEKLGRAIESIFETNYANRKRLYTMSFFKGVAAGFGGVIGATIVVTLLLWALGLLSDVPVINLITEPVKNTVESQQP